MKYVFSLKSRQVALGLELLNIEEVITPLSRIKFGPEPFPNTLFSYVLDSEFTIYGPNWNETVNAGEGVLIFKDEIVETLYKRIRQVRAIQIHFQIHSNDIDNLISIFPRFIKKSDERRILEESIMGCIHAFKRGYLVIAEQEFMAFILELLKIQMKSGVNKYSRHIQKVIEHVHNNIFSALTRKDIAEVCCLNPSYLSYIFHNETGFTLKRYISHAKIQMAKEIMNSTSKNISEVAEEFDMDLYEFSRLFKSVTGFSPSYYSKLY